MMKTNRSEIVLLDIGAANFVLDDRWKGLSHYIKPILFEPDKRNFNKLVAEGYTVYNTALYSENCKKTLNLLRKPECSSFLIPNKKYLRNFPNFDRWDIVGSEELTTRRLDTFDFDIDFVKLDTQGSELEILKGAGEKLHDILGIEIEVSFLEIYEDIPLFGEVCSYLNKYNFQFFDFVTEYRYGRKKLNRKGQLAFADALFLKTPEVVLSELKHKHERYNTIVKAYNKEDLLINNK